jgi:hypothetical protein
LDFLVRTSMNAPVASVPLAGLRSQAGFGCFIK